MKKYAGGILTVGMALVIQMSPLHAADNSFELPMPGLSGTAHESDIQSVSLTPTLPAPETKSEEQDVIHGLIRKQLKAIRDRDAEVAYSLTSNKMHKKYDDAKDYLNTMRFDYRPIYNHKIYSFGEQNKIGDAVLQQVSIEDQYGDEVLVLFRVETKEDKDLAIASFAIIQSEADPL